MHLFAGVGGGLLADLVLGHTPVVAVEWEPYACQVLRERAADGWFPNLRVWEGDVRLFDPSEYAGKVDCLHAGFPCQDISVAGKQAGVGEGTRSGLYREVLRVAGIVRPGYLFLENVAAITSKGLDQVLKDLASMGYDSRWCCLRASDVGAPHHRDRWWLLAYTNSNERSASGLGQDSGADRRNDAGGICEVLADTRLQGICERRKFTNAGEGLQFGTGVSCNGISRVYQQEDEVLADSDSTQREGNECAERSEQERADTGFASWWEVESDVGRVANGVPNRIHRLKGLGNAQCPIQAAVAWKLLGGE